MFGPKPWVTPDMAQLTIEVSNLRRRIRDKRASLRRQTEALEKWSRRLAEIEATRADFRKTYGPVKNPPKSVDTPDPAG